MSIRSIQFHVPGEVRGQSRPRATIRAGHAAVYETAKDKSYKGLIQHYAMEAMEKHGFASPSEPDKKGFSVTLIVFMKYPKAFSQKKRNLAYCMLIKPFRKPDLDNIAKIYLDAMNSIVYPDDRMVTQMSISKVYSDVDRVSAFISWEEN